MTETKIGLLQLTISSERRLDYPTIRDAQCSYNPRRLFHIMVTADRVAPMYETDVVIIGGSVAGLQAALTLGLARRRIVVIDDGRPRNSPANHVHSFLTQTGLTPGDLLASARSMLEPYDV